MPPFFNDPTMEDNPIGLVGRHNGTWTGVPLLGVRVQAQVVDFLAEVQLIQCYHNTSNDTIQAKYYFPVEESAAVCGFQAEYEDGRIVKGIVKEKNEAKRDYHQAVQEGKPASLLETVRRDVFTFNLGNLPPNECVKISITYVTALKAREDAASFVLPTFVAPRFSPPEESLDSEEASALVGTTNSTVRVFGMDVTIDVTCRSNLLAITCPTHENEPSLTVTTSGDKTSSLTLQNIRMDRDLVILITEEQCHQPRAILEQSPTGTLAGFVTLFPQIEFPDQPREFVFLMDRSGSMRHKIVQARDTLLLFLRALPMSSTFNIVGFGSNHAALFPSPQPYNDETLEAATEYAMNLRADMGGTNIQSPLQSILSQTTTMNRQVFVLTDGQVCNDLQVFDTIRAHCSGTHCRLFSVGLGRAASRHLVEGMARAGKGTARFVEDGAAEALQEKVLGQLKQALQPCLDNVRIQWNYPQPTNPATATPMVKTLLGYRSPECDMPSSQPKIVPSNIPPVFNKERFLSFGLFPDGSEVPTSVTVSCTTMDGELETILPIDAAEVFQGTIAHKVAARAAISEYEDHRKAHSSSRGEMMLSQRQALELALANNLASDQTSFVAIMDGPGCEANAIETEEEEVYESPPENLRGSCKRRSGKLCERMVVNRCARKCKKKSRGSPAATPDASALQMDSLDLGSAAALLNAAAIPPASSSFKQKTWEEEMVCTQMQVQFSAKPSLFHETKGIANNKETEAYKEMILEERKSSKEKQKKHAQQQTLIDETANIIEFLRNENTKLKTQQSESTPMDAQEGEQEDHLGKLLLARKAKNAQSLGLTDAELNQKIIQYLRRENAKLRAALSEGQKAAKSKSLEDPLMNLLLLQKANGSFPLNAALARALGLTDAGLNQKVEGMMVCLSDADVIKATALAVAAMRTLFATKKSLWGLQEEKALRFLQSRGLSPVGVEELLAVQF